MQAPSDETIQQILAVLAALLQRVLDLPVWWALLAAVLLAIQAVIFGCLLVGLVLIVKLWQFFLWIWDDAPSRRPKPPKAEVIT